MTLDIHQHSSKQANLPPRPIEDTELDAYALQDPEQILRENNLLSREYGYTAVSPEQLQLIHQYGTYVMSGKEPTNSIFCNVVEGSNGAEKILQQDRADLGLREYLKQNSDNDAVYIVIFKLSELTHIGSGEYEFKNPSDKTAAIVRVCKVPVDG